MVPSFEKGVPTSGGSHPPISLPQIWEEHCDFHPGYGSVVQLFIITRVSKVFGILSNKPAYVLWTWRKHSCSSSVPSALGECSIRPIISNYSAAVVTALSEVTHTTSWWVLHSSRVALCHEQSFQSLPRGRWCQVWCCQDLFSALCR